MLPNSPSPEQQHRTEIGAKRAKLLAGKKYRTRNFMAMLGKKSSPDGISKAILAMMGQFEERHMQTKWRGRHISRPADLERYVCWLYLTGSNKRDPFLKPYPKISISHPRGMPWEIVTVERMRGKGRGAPLKQEIPIFDPVEEKLWKKVLSDYEMMALDDLFERIAKHDAHNGLTSMIQRNFKCDMRDAISHKMLKDASFTPQSFRDHRAYNLYIERGLDEGHVLAFFGWKDSRALKLKAMLNGKEYDQMAALKKLSSIHKAL